MQNLHTHTTYCDGKDTPREMIEKAINLGFDSIGFSGHSYMSYSLSHGMSIEGTEQYFKEINSLKEEYKDEIEIFCGIEYDMYSDIDISYFDYAIGSFHYFKIDDEYVGFDRSKEEVKRVIDTYFKGNPMAYAKRYYEELATLPNYGNFDIIGHFDLVAKHPEICENSKEYISYAVETMESLRDKIPVFEVNTGGIARGYRKNPYPDVELLKELKRLGFKAVISSDCHDAENLNIGFNLAEELLKHCGFKEKYILTKNGFKAVSLEA